MAWINNFNHDFLWAMWVTTMQDKWMLDFHQGYWLHVSPQCWEMLHIHRHVFWEQFKMLTVKSWEISSFKNKKLMKVMQRWAQYKDVVSLLWDFTPIISSQNFSSSQWELRSNKAYPIKYVHNFVELSLFDLSFPSDTGLYCTDIIAVH